MGTLRDVIGCNSNHNALQARDRRDFRQGKSQYFRLTRARVAVSATFAMVGGGQNDPPPPLTRKLGKLESRAIRRSTALSEPIRSHFGHFSLRGILRSAEVIKGQIFEK